jgi:nicotinamide mononucleotide adenylyltransferase
MKKVKTGVIHGRFQILHHDHLKYLLAGFERCEHLIVGIANPDPTLTKQDAADQHRASLAANPLTYYERYLMIREALVEAGLNLEQFSIVPFPINFPELLKFYVPMDATFFLTIYDQWGEKKMARFTELGLKTEILWRRPLAQKGQTASEIREKISTGEPWQDLVPPAMVRLVEEFNLRSRLSPT